MNEKKWMMVASCFLGSIGSVLGESREELEARVQALEAELAQAKAELSTMGGEAEVEEWVPMRGSSFGSKQPLLQPPANVELLEPEAAEEDDGSIRIGPFKFGGAIRANYTLGSYSHFFPNEEAGGNGDLWGAGFYDDHPSRSGEGNIELDTFRINVDFEQGDWIGKAEYRLYDKFGHFFHTLWAGYNFDDGSQIQVGLNRVPFGPGAYGLSNSWFFDMHYYFGLADDMDLGLKYTFQPASNLSMDVGLYAMAEPGGRGDSRHAARYSFDIVDATAGDSNFFGTAPATAYRERGQANIRAIYTLEHDENFQTELGASGQVGFLENRGDGDDAISYAASLHSKTTLDNWTAQLQLTRFDYGTKENHVSGGFYDYTTNIAAEGWIPSASLAYTWTPEDIKWIDSVTFYNEYSHVIKSEPGFNDTQMLTLGAAIASGNWYVYVDWIYSNGNEFVGDYNSDSAAGNPTDDWENRFNVNLGYYF